MQTVHNPDRYMSNLRQILSQGRKRIGFLVGAGAPLSIRVGEDGSLCASGTPLIPAVDELTNQVVAELSDSFGVVTRAIRDEIGNEVNIEGILSRIRLLQTALGQARVHDLNGAGFLELGKSICELIGSKVGASLPCERCAYHELVSWISGMHRPSAIEIFTTNYDVLFEEAFEAARVPYFDGFSGGNRPFFDPVAVAGDDLPARWSRIWKLHGSLGWTAIGDDVVRSGGRAASQLVYPDHLKYDLTQKQPYTALFERLRRFVLAPDTVLLAVGFSFRDAHICDVIKEALAFNSNSSVFAFQWKCLADEGPACELALYRPNMSVYAADGAVIGGVRGPWRIEPPPDNWHEIRKTFWGSRQENSPPVFLLGDFVAFARFCALSQAADLVSAASARQDESIGIEAPGSTT